MIGEGLSRRKQLLIACVLVPFIVIGKYLGGTVGMWAGLAVAIMAVSFVLHGPWVRH